MFIQFKNMIVSMFMAMNVGGISGQSINMGNISFKDAACLSQAVHGEAGNQPFEGKVAVAQVIVNRTKDGRFPSDICGVVHQRGQFDFLQHIRWIRRDNPAEEEQMKESIQAAALVLNEEVDDITRGSLFFANPKLSTDRRWLRSLKKTMRIGDHVFYRRNIM